MGNGGWAAPEDGLADPGWMLPLVVFAHVYTAHLVVTTFEEMYERQRPCRSPSCTRPGPRSSGQGRSQGQG